MVQNPIPEQRRNKMVQIPDPEQKRRKISIFFRLLLREKISYCHFNDSDSLIKIGKSQKGKGERGWRWILRETVSHNRSQRSKILDAPCEKSHDDFLPLPQDSPSRPIFTRQTLQHVFPGRVPPCLLHYFHVIIPAHLHWRNYTAKTGQLVEWDTSIAIFRSIDRHAA